MRLDAVALALGSYALGCCMAAYYLVRWKTGEDIRALGSGNVGATNARRILGRAGFVLTFVIDCGKGALAVAVGRWLAMPEWAVAASAVAVVAGHVWPAQLGFRGGKGVATATGALIFLDPVLVLAQILAFLGLWAMTRRRDGSALASYALLPVLGFSLDPPDAMLAGASAVAVVVLWAHWSRRAALHGVAPRGAAAEGAPHKPGGGACNSQSSL